MKKWNMIVDVAKCNNCYNCFVATKDEYVGNEHAGYAAPQPLHEHNWVDIKRAEGGQWPIVEAQFRPEMCNHCDDAPCMKVAKDGAIKKRDDGIVIIDPVKSKGQKQIVDACPYGAVYWNEELEIPQAWPFDAHLLDDGWDKTKIESVCPTDALYSLKVTDAEMSRLAEDEGMSTLTEMEGAKPRVYYKNADVFDTCFIGGTVVTEKNGVEDCVSNAKVTALRDGEEISAADTDAFGEFKLGRFPKGFGQVTIVVNTAMSSKSMEVTVDESVYVGCIEVDS